MQLQLFKTLWGHEGSIRLAADRAVNAGFHGIEGPAPENRLAQQRWKSVLYENNLRYIAEITTAGSYIPDRSASLHDHLESFKRKLEHSLALEPVFITCLGGCDAWPEQQNLEFYARAMQIADSVDVVISFETHRGRAFFNPWVTDRIVAQLPDIKLTCDFSHWCVVCERLMDSELEIIQRLAANAWHIHARVGYEQGPQVPNPAAMEYEYALRAHQHWWELIWQQQILANRKVTTMTAEYGPDGYLHEQPFSREPVANLWALNQWMANEEKLHFKRFMEQEDITSDDVSPLLATPR